MYKHTQITYMQNPPSCGGNWETGTYTTVSFSNSPKKACALGGIRTSFLTGVEGCPLMDYYRLERDGKLIFEFWD
jgi:hypothetical protein